MARFGVKRGKVKEIKKSGTDKNGVDYVVYRLVESYKSGGVWKYCNWNCYTSGDDVKKIKVDTMLMIQGNLLQSANKVGERTYVNYTVFTDTKKSESDQDGVVVLDAPASVFKTQPRQETNVSDLEELPFD